MALENISNVPEVCSESLLEHFIFNIYLPLRRLRRLCGTVSHRTPPGKKILDPPLFRRYFLLLIIRESFHSSRMDVSEHNINTLMV